jgi:EAL domain-containing protein (putative c-di-GMP-specific phosphodiesterase class I)
MYAAKANNGGVRIHDHTHTQPPGHSKLAILADLRQGIASGDVTVHVQPQAHAHTGHVYGVEALIRWHHPHLGVLAPAAFLPLAERHGLIHDLTDLVLDQAVAAAAAWRTQGLDLSVAVNLTAHSLTDTRILTTVDHVLRRHGLPPSRLTLEITEDTVISDPASTIAQLATLRATGVRLSVDDFGTGYSSLSYLRRLPVHEVKIDRSFITTLSASHDDQKIVRSIIDLAHNLSLDVVAEGVEDQPTWDRLTELGCHTIQGNHLAPAMPVPDLQPWLQDSPAEAVQLTVFPI